MAEDPAKAAMIANAMADEYLVSQVEAKFQAAERATDWLGKRIQELRGEVLEAEAKIVEYRSRNNLVNTDDSNPVTLQFFQLNSQLALAQAERAGAEARLGQARAMLNAENGVAGCRAGAELAGDGGPARAGAAADPQDLRAVVGDGRAPSA